MTSRIKAISAHARREKSIRHGHISTLHIWWARRPLAACRAVICASLWPDPADPLCPQMFRETAATVLGAFAENVRTDKRVMELCAPHWSRWRTVTADTFKPETLATLTDLRAALLDFIADFANWDASALPAFLVAARALTDGAHRALGGAPGTHPLVLNPFAGGGSMPLEALRVGADAHASDLNPIAVLLNKVALEYVPRHGERLAAEFLKRAAWVGERARQRLTGYFPEKRTGYAPIAYLWARTILCEGPECGVEIPLIRSAWLAKKGRRSVGLTFVASEPSRGRQRRIEITSRSPRRRAMYRVRRS